MKNNNKIIYALLLMSILILSGCTNDKSAIDNSGKQQLSDIEIDKLSASLDKDITVSKFEPLDTDNDGSYDKFVLTLDKKEIDEDLFLEKSVEYKKTEEGFMGTLTLEFENTGDETKTYSHIENIPKSFAAHVDDIEFSVPPTKIINPDPKVVLEVDIMKRNSEKIIIKAKNAATDAAIKVNPGRIIALLLTGFSDKPSKKLMEAEMNAAGGVLLDNLGALVFFNDFNDCDKFGEDKSLWNTCIVNLMIKSPDMFIESDCEKIDIDYSDAKGRIKGPVLYGMCKAIMTKDWKECHDNADTWKEIDICKAVMFKSLSLECEYTKDKDECIYNAALKSNSGYGCRDIVDKISKNGCFAEITQDIAYCERINDKDAKKYCCDKIVDDDARKECYGDEEVEEDTFGVDFDCPIPAGAEFFVENTDAVYEHWELDGKYVGIAKSWSDKERKIKSALRCFNAEGNLHGVSWNWNSDGSLFSYREYKDSKLDGVSKRWYEDGTLFYEKNYKNDKLNGLHKEWFKDGSPHSEEGYLDDKKHGIDKWWYESGTLRTDRTFKDGKVYGSQKFWYEDGTQSHESNHNNHGPHGLWMDWYEDGSPQYERNYIDGKKDGLCRDYLKHGIYECTFKNGVKDNCKLIK